MNRFTHVVRQGGPTRTLTQSQFDALVSFAYNAPAPVTRNVLNAAERSDVRTATTTMTATVNVHGRGVHGRLGSLVMRQGLVTRRAGKVGQYGRTDQP